jgi:hypothetical protein
MRSPVEPGAYPPGESHKAQDQSYATGIWDRPDKPGIARKSTKGARTKYCAELISALLEINFRARKLGAELSGNKSASGETTGREAAPEEFS